MALTREELSKRLEGAPSTAAQARLFQPENNLLNRVASQNVVASEVSVNEYSETGDLKPDNPAFSKEEMIDVYLFGLPLKDQSGNPFPESMYASFINSAINYAESMFDICLKTVEVKDETHDYERDDWSNWGYMQLFKRPIKSINSFQLLYGTRPSFDIPLDWLKIDKLSGKVQMFPASGNVNSLIITGTGAIYGLHNYWSYAPQMWNICYTAGMEPEDIPFLLKELIYKKACIGILQTFGDLILGAGIANQSISIDGLSQSIGTTQSAMYGGASARINDYRKDIEDAIPVLRQKYGSIRMVVL